jgi:hypothetical protein
MLGSEHAGERSAAALKATQLLRQHGLTWADVTLPGADEVDDLVMEVAAQEMARRSAWARASQAAREPYPGVYAIPDYDPKSLTDLALREHLNDFVWARETQLSLCTHATFEMLKGLNQKLTWTVGGRELVVDALRHAWGIKATA